MWVLGTEIPFSLSHLPSPLCVYLNLIAYKFWFVNIQLMTNSTVLNVWGILTNSVIFAKSIQSSCMYVSIAGRQYVWVALNSKMMNKNWRKESIRHSNRPWNDAFCIRGLLLSWEQTILCIPPKYDEYWFGDCGMGGHSDGGGVTDKFLTHNESMNNEDRLYAVKLEGFTEETSVWLVGA